LKELGESVDSSSKEEIEAAIKAVRDVLTSEDAAEINNKTEALQASFHKVSEAMYQRAQQEAAASGDGASSEHNGAGSADEEVVDAEVVDEGKK
jgi:molecular chaperone DnaK